MLFLASRAAFRILLRDVGLGADPSTLCIIAKENHRSLATDILSARHQIPSLLTFRHTDVTTFVSTNSDTDSAKCATSMSILENCRLTSLCLSFVDRDKRSAVHQNFCT